MIGAVICAAAAGLMGTGSGLGQQRMNFAVVLHAGDWKAAKLYREIKRCREPIDGEDVRYKLTVDAPDMQRGLSVGPDTVMLSAFFQDSGAVMLRIYENEGAPALRRRISAELVDGLQHGDYVLRRHAGLDVVGVHEHEASPLAKDVNPLLDLVGDLLGRPFRQFVHRITAAAPEDNVLAV
ncbi:MAG: hypothetical protein ACYS8X_00395, partial [Planctomycetota bacterium]